MSHTLRFALRCLDRIRQPTVSRGGPPSAQLDSDHDAFFDAVPGPAQEEDFEIEPIPDSTVERKRRPEVRARRATLTRYVQAIVAALAVLCIIAFAKLVAERELGARVEATRPMSSSAKAN